MLRHAPVTPMLPVVDYERAKSFYGSTLGLRLMEEPLPGNAMFECGNGTRLGIYQRGATKADHTVACFSVDDLEAEMKALRQKGVTFEEYDFPGLKTVNGVATIGSYQSAWFKDPEGNIVSLTQEG